MSNRWFKKLMHKVRRQFKRKMTDDEIKLEVSVYYRH